ncbi:MAG TPA: UDP-3-O-(3-hydroxymyristoyl)glucosamine N-acyltransferase [Caulobacteraceae bacterium]|nr:UDP-3-O-(3-hydroxymyristoyl)glucosamine N-acyltransferase [Caulobacteraceae bacterium]
MNSPDPRFFEALGPVTLGALADLTGATCDTKLAGRSVTAASVLSRADAGGVSFLDDRRSADLARATAAGACFVSPKEAGRLPESCAGLLTPAPRAAWAAAALRLHRPRRHDPSSPAVHPDALIEDGVSLGHGATVGPGAQIGAGTVIGSNVSIGPGVAIGRGCQISAGVVIGFALIGDNVRILANSVIGEAGFGLAVGPKGLVDVPQLGRVIIQDGVSIGANTCVDRGAFEDTVIGENTKIDNLVQIAHNVSIGRNCAIAGHCGISGSVVIGDGVRMGGRVGLADHVSVGSGAQLAAASGLMHDVPPGEAWAGIPAKPMRRWMREMTWLAKAAASRRDRGEA